MKKLIPFLLLLSSLSYAQDYTVRQNDHNDRKIYFDFVDATDGYTAETGITPTCTFLRPLASSFVSCVNSVAEIGTGKYRLTLSEAETQNLGMGAIYVTHASIRPVRINLNVVSDNRSFSEGATWIKSPSNYNNTSWWNKTGTTVTEDSTADYSGNTIGDTVTGDGANSQHRIVFPLAKPEGSGYYYFTTEVKSGSLNNAWIGDYGWGAGGDFNTSTGVFTPPNSSSLRGWKVDKLASSWWRIHIIYSATQTDATALSATIALNDGTSGTIPSTFTTSGTMIFARTHLMRAEDVSPTLLAEILPNLQTASSSTSVTLSLGEGTSTNPIIYREICFVPGYSGSAYHKVFKICSCITAYDGTTKVATISPATYATLNSSYKYQIGGLCLNNVNVSSMSNNVISSSTIATSAIGADEIATDAIGSSEIATSAMGADEIAASAITSSEFSQSAADKVWNTAPQDGSASTALGYLDAIKKYVSNKMSIVGSNYTIYKDDQTTSYATGTTNSSGRDPD